MIRFVVSAALDCFSTISSSSFFLFFSFLFSCFLLHISIEIMLRLFNRFYTLCAVAAVTLLYSAWVLTSRHLGNSEPLVGGSFRTVSSFDRRLVVFGDSWSNVKTEERQGRVWTDWLCEMVRLMPSPLPSPLFSHHSRTYPTPRDPMRYTTCKEWKKKGEMGNKLTDFDAPLPFLPGEG